MYELLGDSATSDLIKKSVNELFYLKNHGWYADAIHWDGAELRQAHHFDSLGNAWQS